MFAVQIVWIITTQLKLQAGSKSSSQARCTLQKPEDAVTCQKTHLGWPRCADHVYQEIKPQAKDGILACMEREREGDQADCALLREQCRKLQML